MRLALLIVANSRAVEFRCFSCVNLHRPWKIIAFND
jgi:hypothetical protein